MRDTLSALICCLPLVCLACASSPAAVPSVPSSGVGSTLPSTRPSSGAEASEGGSPAAPSGDSRSREASGSEVGESEGPEEASTDGGGGGPEPGAAEGEAPNGGSEASSGGDRQGGASVPELPAAASTPQEKTAELDRELDESLGKFDELLTRERQAQETRRANAGGAPGAGGGGKGRGTASGPDGPESEAGSEAASQGGSETGGEGAGGEHAATGGGAVGGGATGARQDDGEGSEPEAGDRGRVPADVGSGADDDIVARQIREAAINEEDPELREKLWEEYRQYKKGQGRSDD